MPKDYVSSPKAHSTFGIVFAIGTLILAFRETATEP